MDVGHNQLYLSRIIPSAKAKKLLGEDENSGDVYGRELSIGPPIPDFIIDRVLTYCIIKYAVTNSKLLMKV